GELLFVDSFGMNSPKTKDAVAFLKSFDKVHGLEKLGTKKMNAALITTFEKDVNVSKSFANVGSVFVSEIRNINPLDLLKYKYLVIGNPEKSVEIIKERLTK
ncbi:MAG: 50S ribosomal protein L4, partial [Patescibacteria group bacterium]